MKDTYGEELDLKGYSDRSETRFVYYLSHTPFSSYM